MKLKQCTLSLALPSNGRDTTTVGWIDAKAAVVGYWVKIDGDARWWVVDVAGEIEREKNEIPRGWKVGGLG